MKQIPVSGVSLSMQCNRLIPGSRIKVDYLWEVRIPVDLWHKIQAAAEDSNRTYSWVVRWCVFTALKSCNKTAFSAAVMELHNRGNKGASNGQSHHRFPLCLYGKDQTWLKITALDLETSVTTLILAALQLFLHTFLEQGVPSLDLFEHGIKIVARCQIDFDYLGDFPQGISQSFQYYQNIILKNIREGVVTFKFKRAPD